MRPFPLGRYPLVVVGSGPGALQVSYVLGRHRVPHAVLSADRGPGGMFRRFPFFDRLISWTKPYPPTDGGATAAERFDWNSLLAFNRRHQGLVRREMGRTSYFPSRAEMHRGLVRFTDLTGIQVRYHCSWEGTTRRGDDYVLSTSDGEYVTPLLVFGIGVTDPWLPRFDGVRHVTHYVDLSPPRRYAGRRVLVLGKRNSGFETAHGLLPWASRIVMASPSPVSFSVDVGHPSAARAVYMQPFEDHVLGGGHCVLDAAPVGIERTAGALRVTLEGTTIPGRSVFEVDDVIGATGFRMPVKDLEAAGVATLGHRNLPSLTAHWESSTAPGVYFAGAASAGAPGLERHGRASNSGVVNGFRHNARVLAAHLASARLGRTLPAQEVPRAQVPEYLLRIACTDGALWNQQAYLAHSIRLGRGRSVDTGLEPLTHFLDSSGEPAVAITIETPMDGGTRPVVYLRNSRGCSEHHLEAGPLLEFHTPGNVRMLKALLRGR